MLSDRELYRRHMRAYADATAALSMVKYDNPSFQAILLMGNRALPFLLEDIQAQHPDGSWDNKRSPQFSFWAGCALLRSIVRDKSPVLAEKDRGRLSALRSMWVDWGVERGLLDPRNEPTIPLRWGEIYRFVPKRFSALRNYVWRLTTLPNKHRMHSKWDFWRAI